jgi:hypothetical protein
VTSEPGTAGTGEGGAPTRAAGSATGSLGGAGPVDPGPVGLDTKLAPVRTKLAAAAVVARLDALARRGKLAGFVPAKGGSGDLFYASAFGTPFDGELVCRYETAVQGGSAGAGGSAGGTLVFHTRLKPTIPWVFFALLVLSVWPGVLLAESLMASYFPAGWSVWTWWWYIPLTLPTVPWGMWWGLKRSRALVHDEAHRVVRRISAELGADAPAAHG